MLDKATLRNTRETKDNRRSQLIDATVKVISHYGLSNTTVAKVTQEAGLSIGIVTFYFNSKEKLLLGTLKALSDEFMDRIKSSVEANEETEDKMYAIIDAHFEPGLCDIDKIAVWSAFCSESSARKEYMEICGEQDAWFRKTLDDLFSEFCQKYKIDRTNASVLSRGMEGLLDGLWQDYLYQTDEFDRNLARQFCDDYLSAIFPGISRTSSILIDIPTNSKKYDQSMTDQYLPVWTYYDAEFFEPFEQVGATAMNGTTWFDRTNYFENVPTPALDMALWLESDRMGHLLGAVSNLSSVSSSCPAGPCLSWR